MIKGSWALGLALLLAPVTAQAVPQTAPERHLTARDLFDLEVASDVQISPDGRWIAYVRNSGDVMTDRMRPTIWLVDAATGQQRPLIAGTGSHNSPRWSPSGDRLAYISSAGSGPPQLFVRWIGSGESVRITGLPNSPSSIAWSPDGTQIAYTMFVPEESPRIGTSAARPEGAQWADPLQVITAITYRADGAGYLHSGYDQIFLVSADGGAPRQLTFGPFENGGPLSWTPDGRTIVFSGNRQQGWEREPVDSDVYALDLAGSTVSRLTDRYGPDQSPAVSPDGRLIAYVGFDDRHLGYQNQILYVMNRDGSGRRALTGGFDRSLDDPTWSRDGRTILVDYDDHGMRKVARVSLDGTVHEVAAGLGGEGLDRPYTGGNFSASRDGAIAFSGGSAMRPADVMLVRGGGRRQLTHLNAELLDGKALGEVRPLPVTSSFDHEPIDAWLTLPPGHTEGQRHPLILEIHGGPFSAYGPNFSTDDQLYAAAGYAVLSVNPRGSTSYGEAFANQIHLAYPGHDYDDLMSAVDAAIAAGVADPDHLFVTGGSGGGVLTAWIVGHTNRFRAAASQKPVIDWASFALTSDNPTYYSRYWFAHYPWEDPQGYWARSPLSVVGNVTTPTLVVVGSEDYRTPGSEAEQLYSALQLRGVPTALVRVPGASHGGLAARPSQSGAKASAILAWFERYRDYVPPAVQPAAAGPNH